VWGQGDAGGRGERNHLMRRRSWLQEHRREKQVGGGDPGGGGVLLAESRDSRARRGRGSAARCLEAGPASTGKLGLPGPKKPHAQGFQKRMMGFAWKNSARAADAGNRRVPSGDLGFQTRPTWTVSLLADKVVSCNVNVSAASVTLTSNS